MAASLVTHLNFRGNAREALEFYHSVFGGQLMIGTYGEGGVPRDSATSEQAEFDPVPADSPDAEHVSFGMVAGEGGFRLAAYDVFGATGGGPASSGLAGATTRVDGLTHTQDVFLVLNGETVDEVTELWRKLADGGTVIQALAPAPWAPIYGMLLDRFGVTWVFGVAPQ
jgi:PhnB protein